MDMTTNNNNEPTAKAVRFIRDMQASNGSKQALLTRNGGHWIKSEIATVERQLANKGIDPMTYEVAW